MVNPYRAPTSDVDNGKIKPGSKLKWKVLFWIILILEVISLVMMFADPEENLFHTVSELLVYSAILTGLFGFSYNKKIFTRKPWRYLIPVGICWDIYSIFTMNDFAVTDPEQLYFTIGVMMIIILPIVVFQYIALYKYSYQSDEIWQ